MPKKTKLKLENIKVKSFITNSEAQTVKGGTGIQTDCVDMSCLTNCSEPAFLCGGTVGTESCAGTCDQSCNGTCATCITCNTCNTCFNCAVSDGQIVCLTSANEAC